MRWPLLDIPGYKLANLGDRYRKIGLYSIEYPPVDIQTTNAVGWLNVAIDLNALTRP